MKIPKPVYPKELTPHQRMFGEYVLAENNQGVLLAIPCASPYIKKQVQNKLKYSKTMKEVRRNL